MLAFEIYIEARFARKVIKLYFLSYFQTAWKWKLGSLYSKSQISAKKSILTKPQHFHEFFSPNFFDNFSREIKVVNS